MGWLHHDDLFLETVYYIPSGKEPIYSKFLCWKAHHKSNRYGGPRLVVYQNMEQARPFASSYHINSIPDCKLRLLDPSCWEEAPSRLLGCLRGVFIDLKLHVAGDNYHLNRGLRWFVNCDSPWKVDISFDRFHRSDDLCHPDRHRPRKTNSIRWRVQSDLSARGGK